MVGAPTFTDFVEPFFGIAVWSVDHKYQVSKIFVIVYLPRQANFEAYFSKNLFFLPLKDDMDKLCWWTCFQKMPYVSLHLKKNKSNNIESFYPDIFLFYYPFNKKLNKSNVKLFDVKFRYVIHFKTVEVHFNATFGEYQILSYRYLSKIM